MKKIWVFFSLISYTGRHRHTLKHAKVMYGLALWYSRFCIHSSVHRNSILIRSNKMKQYAGIYLLQNHSTCFGCTSHPSSGVHNTVTAASGADHSIWSTTFLQRGQLATLEEGCCYVVTMTCTRGCSYSFMYSWWWVCWTPETRRVILQ